MPFAAATDDDVGEQVERRQHIALAELAAHALGTTGGARRVDHHVAERRIVDRRVRLPVRERCGVGEPCRGVDAEPLEGQLGGGRGDEIGEAGFGDHDPAVAVAEHVGDLGGGQVEVDRRDVQPRLDRRQVRRHQLDPVAEHGGHGVARAQAERAQAMGEGIGRGDERSRVHRAPAGLDERRTVGSRVRLRPDADAGHAHARK